MRTETGPGWAPLVAAGVTVTGVVLALGAGILAWRGEGIATAGLEAGRATELVAFLVFVLIGALLVVRRPEHRVGWLLAATGTSVLLQQATQGYALLRVGGGPDLPGAEFAAWVATWSITLPLALLGIMLLVFPTGRAQSPRWRAFTWVVGATGTAITLAWALWAWPVRSRLLAAEPLPAPAVLETGTALLAVALPIAVVSLLLRYRAAERDTQRQLRWLLLAALGVLLATAAGLVTEALGESSSAIDALGSISFAGVAAAIALAVLRYRLYEIDRILARTVSYLVVTVTLGLVYGVVVLSVGTVLEPVAADSPLAVAASTLAVAGAFHPVRARTQGAVDRRFNRAHHDREQVVGSFGARLRNDYRLEPLCADLVATAVRVVEPAHASVWLRRGVATTPTRPPLTTGAQP